MRNGQAQWKRGALCKYEKWLSTSPLPTRARAGCDNGPGDGGVPVDSPGELMLRVSLWLRGTTQVKNRTFPPTGDFLKHCLGRVFAQFIFWSDNNLTLILLFSAGTKPGLRLYHPSVICVAGKELWVWYRKKVGVLLGFPAGQHTGLLLGLFFLDYRITIILATSFFHPGPDTIFIDLYKLRQYTILSVLLPTFFRVFFKKKKKSI